jgi:hypothetical protein
MSTLLCELPFFEIDKQRLMDSLPPVLLDFISASRPLMLAGGCQRCHLGLLLAEF